MTYLVALLLAAFNRIPEQGVLTYLTQRIHASLDRRRRRRLWRASQKRAQRILAQAGIRYAFARGLYATTKMHTDVPLNSPGTSAVVNSPLGQLDSALADAEAAALGDFVSSGGLAPTSGTLTVAQPSCRAFVLNTYVQPLAQNLVMTASKDNYVDLDNAGAYHITPVTLAAAAPAVFANSIRLYKAVTNATAVTSVLDLRPLSAAGRGAYGAGQLVFDVINYGADPTGVANSDAAFLRAAQAAVAVTYGNPFGTVFIPPGAYRLDSGLLPMSANTYNLIGAAPGSVTLKFGATFNWATVANGQGIVEVGAAGCKVGGFFMDGTSCPNPGSSKYAFHANGGNNNQFPDIWVKNFLGANSIAAVFDSGGAQHLVTNLWVANCFKGLLVTGTSLNLVFVNCLLSNCPTTGLNLEIAGSATDIFFYALLLDEGVGTETASGAITSATVTRTNFIGCRLTAGGSVYPIDIRAAATKTRFTDCYLGPWTGAANSGGLKIAAGADVYAHGCFFHATGGVQYGIENAGTFIDGGGNTIDSTHGAGVFTNAPGGLTVGNGNVGAQVIFGTSGGAGTWVWSNSSGTSFILQEQGVATRISVAVTTGVVRFQNGGVLAPAASSTNLADAIAPDLSKWAYHNPPALTASQTVAAPLNPVIGQVLTFQWTQDGTGGRVITYNAVFKQGGAVAATTAGNSIMIDRFYYDGSNWRIVSRITGQGL